MTESESCLPDKQACRQAGSNNMVKLLRIGIVGCGAIGSSLAKIISVEFSEKAQLAGVYDIDLEKARKLANYFNDDKLIALNLDDLLNMSDLVIEASKADSVFDIVKKAKILHVAGSFLMPNFDGVPTARVLKQAREWGITTSLDTAWDSKDNWLKVLKPCLQYLDIFMPSIEEARMITGKDKPSDIAEFLMSYGIKTVALKMGDRGSYVRTPDWEFFLPIYKVNAVDSTGAGDAFAAGFLAGVAKGWDYRDAARLGNAVGACCVTAIGSSAGIKNMDETLEFIDSYKA